MEVTMRPHGPALVGLLIAAGFLAVSLFQPFLTSAFEPEFPPKVRRVLEVYDGAFGKWMTPRGGCAI